MRRQLLVGVCLLLWQGTSSEPLQDKGSNHEAVVINVEPEETFNSTLDPLTQLAQAIHQQEPQGSGEKQQQQGYPTENQINFDKLLDEVAKETLSQAKEGTVISDESFLKNTVPTRPPLPEASTTTSAPNSCPSNRMAMLDGGKTFPKELKEMKQALLESLLCGRNNCSTLVVYSNGRPALVQPARFGVFHLSTLHDRYPAFSRPGTNQHLFFQIDLKKWEYAYRIQRWIIGSQIDDAVGGILIMSTERCPWKISFHKVDTYYFEKKPRGLFGHRENGWTMDDSIRIECFNEEDFPSFGCRCQELNVSLSAKTSETLQTEFTGVYQVMPKHQWNTLAPVYGTSDGHLLYSHDPWGRVWLMGKSLTSWAFRLSFLNVTSETEASDSKKKKMVLFCPQDARQSHIKAKWEMLVKRVDEIDIWKPVPGLRVQCV